MIKDLIIRTSARAEKLWLTVRRTGEVILTVPRHASKRYADEFVKTHEDWVMRKLKSIARNRPLPRIRGGERHYERHKEEARRVVTDLVLRHAGKRFAWKRIAVRRQRTRWGSCSEKGNLNFNYKLLFLPPELREYVVVHELCHLEEFNHSAKFWKLVESILPDYKKLRAELRRHAP